MNFLVDAQLPPRLADWLRAQGHAATAVRDIGMQAATDDEIWRHASKENAIIVTKDEDFAAMTGRLVPGPQILWVRTGNLLTPHLLDRFAAAWPQAETLLREGSRLVELR